MEPEETELCEGEDSVEQLEEVRVPSRRWNDELSDADADDHEVAQPLCGLKNEIYSLKRKFFYPVVTAAAKSGRDYLTPGRLALVPLPSEGSAWSLSSIIAGKRHVPLPLP